jgi:hypothetical protein
VRPRRTLSPEQQAASEVRRARFRTLAEQIAALSPDERLAMAGRMAATVTIEGRTLSVHNACLVGAQCPSATMVGGFHQWIKAGRMVRKGEKGLMIWAPTKRPDTLEQSTAADEGRPARHPGFIMVTVFDVAQTDPKGTSGNGASPDPDEGPNE